MKALLITVGSRGDAEPFCALASELGNAGHTVDLFLQVDLTYLAPTNNNVKVCDLPFTMMDFYKVTAPGGGGKKRPSSSHRGGEVHDDPSNPRVKFIGVVADIIAELVLPCEPHVSRVVANHKETKLPVDIIICSSLARPLALLVPHNFYIPVGLVHLQPLVPTRDFPHYSMKEKCIEAILSPPDSNSSNNKKNGKDEFLES